MENSRHERAYVVMTSYVIGFTSAFIAFGINHVVQTDFVVIEDLTQTAAVQQPAMQPRMGQSYSASIRIEPAGLVVVSEAGKRLLSARKDSPYLASVISSEAQPGLAVKIVEAELSRDSRFVYFCEQLQAEAQSCVAYVYNIASDVLHPLKVRGAVYEPQIVTHTSAWSQDGNLMVDGFISSSPLTPWELQ